MGLVQYAASTLCESQQCGQSKKRIVLARRAVDEIVADNEEPALSAVAAISALTVITIAVTASSECACSSSAFGFGLHYGRPCTKDLCTKRSVADVVFQGTPNPHWMSGRCVMSAHQVHISRRTAPSLRGVGP